MNEMESEVVRIAANLAADYRRIRIVLWLGLAWSVSGFVMAGLLAVFSPDPLMASMSLIAAVFSGAVVLAVTRVLRAARAVRRERSANSAG